MENRLTLTVSNTQGISNRPFKQHRFIEAVYIELIALMTQCLVDRACTRRVQEIRLLLRRLQVDYNLPNDMQEKLEGISYCWEQWNYLSQG